MARLPVVVVGAGIAGLATVLAAAPAPAIVLHRGRGASDCATALAQGGIAASLGPGDTPESHARDTLVAGAWHNDASMVHWLCAQAPAAIHWLQAQGVGFDRDADGLRLAREGGHAAARVVHAGGDASGAELLRALRRRVRSMPNVQFRGDSDVDGMLMRGDAACGVRVRDGSGRQHEIEAAAVVLATGGIGALYARTSNPPGADGAGLALALAAGACARDLEFVQFHPTVLAVQGAQRLPLITEALRGVGARLRDEQGRPLMDGLHPLADLAPRDVVARRVWREHDAGRRVWLDATRVDCDWQRQFPGVLAACAALGFDPRRTPIPVGPAAHFHMGGIAVDAHGRSSVPRLFAVGEAACNGVHGANRLASNSLLEGVLCGQRVGSLLRDDAGPPSRAGHSRWVMRGGDATAASIARLRECLWHVAGPVRRPVAMRQALRWLDGGTGCGWQGALARRLLVAALRRPANLGAHWHDEAA